MIQPLNNMSKTPVLLPNTESLRLDFLEAGAHDHFPDGTFHQKVLPCAIIAQARSGAYEMRCAGDHVRAEAGRFVVVPAHTPVEITHWANGKKTMAARWIHLRFTIFGLVDFLSLYEIPLLLPRRVSRSLDPVVARILQIQNRPATPAIFLLRQELALRTLSLICSASQLKADHEARIKSYWSRLRPTLEFIEQRFADPLTTGKLARMASLSSSQFHALFKDELGVGPMAYVRQLRLDAACRRLVASHETVGQVAEAVGFGDPFHFSKAFKEHAGMSPRAYREQATWWSQP
ncbi:hypothetical protein BH09VER1_BH09VER1_01290 [soil metagenome]